MTMSESDKQARYDENWKKVEDLRGNVDGWDFKAYVFGAIFYRFLSENLTERLNEQERAAGDVDFDYAELEDEFFDDEEGKEEIANIVNEFGYFIKPSELFQTFCPPKKQEEEKNEDATKQETDDKQVDTQKDKSQDKLADEKLNVVIDQIFKNIESSASGTASERNFKGLFADFNVASAKLGGNQLQRVQKLRAILTTVAELSLREKGEPIEEYGNAFEDLMTRYAANAGKSGGEFFTPADVSALLAKIVVGDKKRLNKVYDPACGSGSLLLKVGKEIGREQIVQGFFGQEINLTNYNLCRMNMLMHGVAYNFVDVENEDTLTNPCAQHWDKQPFEAIVSNPPYSKKWVGEDDASLSNDPRFIPAGVLAPKAKSDFAFTMHALAWLAPNGTAALVSFPGTLYRGGKELKIRQYLVDQNFVDAVLQLPANLFFGTSIATCVLILKKGKRDNNVLFLDASEQCVKVTNNNRMTNEHIQNIADALEKRENVPYFAKVVSYQQIKEQEYNLSVSNYVEQKENKEIVDIEKLNDDIEQIVKREDELRRAIKDIIREINGK